jgi:hypothetical protein
MGEDYEGDLTGIAANRSDVIKDSILATGYPPVSMRVIVSPARMYEYTKRSIAMLGATRILNWCLSAWITGVICIAGAFFLCRELFVEQGL